MRFGEILRSMLRAFFVITTGITISMYVFCLIFNKDAGFSLDDIGRILKMALISELPYFVFYSRKELDKKQMLIRFMIHIPVLSAVLFYLASLWKWINVNSFNEVLVFFLLIIGVYALVLAASFYKDKKTADKLNDTLKERYHS